MIEMAPYITVAIIIGIGLYICMFKSNLIKIVMGIALIESGVNLFLITLGYRHGASAPIFTMFTGGLMALPTPQALTLTSIVIGVATTALLLAFVIKIYRHYGSIDAKDARRLKG